MVKKYTRKSFDEKKLVSFAVFTAILAKRLKGIIKHEDVYGVVPLLLSEIRKEILEMKKVNISNFLSISFKRTQEYMGNNLRQEIVKKGGRLRVYPKIDQYFSKYIKKYLDEDKTFKK